MKNMTEPQKPQLQENKDHGLMTQADQDETVSPLNSKGWRQKELVHATEAKGWLLYRYSSS
jgi:hypothetical protein